MDEYLGLTRNQYLSYLKRLNRTIRRGRKARNRQELLRRAEALRIAVAVSRNSCHHVAAVALRDLSVGDLELLISAFGADREKRPLCEDEEMARQHYTSVVARLSRYTGLPVLSWLGATPDISLIYKAAILATVLRLPTHTIQRCRELPDYCPVGMKLRYTSAQETVDAHCDRLAVLAGFADYVELMNAVDSWETEGWQEIGRMFPTEAPQSKR